MSDTPISDLVEKMLNAGSLPAMVVLAAREMERAIVARETSRDASRSVTVPSRSPAAIRAARYRENLKQKQATAKANDVAGAGDEGVTPRRDASRDGVTAHCDSSSSFLERTGKKEKKEGDRTEVVEGRRRGTRIPPDWQPTDADRQFAREHGLDPDRVAGEFKDFWESVPGSRGTKLDWSKTWRVRVRQIASKPQSGRGPSSRGLSTGDLLMTADRMRREARETPATRPDETAGGHRPDDRQLGFDQQLLGRSDHG